MSASARGASKANKDKTTKTQTTQSKADGPPNKLQASSEQLRIAQLASVGSKDVELQTKILQVMELTGRSDEDAALALHDCGNDLQKAINMLLEGNTNEGEWEESAASKKKKRQQQNAALKPPEEAETNHKPHRTERGDRPPRSDSNRDRSESAPRIPRNAPPRMANRGLARGRDMSRGDRSDREWRGKESEENERNREDSARRGRGRGRGRGAPRRGGGFGRPNRFNQDNGPQIDTWSNDVADQDPGKTQGEDWSVEEWTGSLAESQVFTASSTQQAPTIDTFSATDADDSAPLGGSVTTTTTLPSATPAFPQTRLDVGSLFDKSATDQFTAQYNKQATESLKTAMGLTKLDSDLGSLGSSQFSKEATESLKSIMGIGTTVQNSSPSLPQRTVSPAVTKPHKTRLPPPSKIPTAPVEMPGSTYSSSGTGFDLQFGNLDLGKDNDVQAPATFSFGNDTSAFTTSSYSTAGDVPTMSNHLGQVGMDGGQSAASLMSSAQSGLDSQSSSMFHQSLDSNNYQQTSSKMTSPPEPIPFPSSTQSDRKSSPLLSNQRPSSGPGSLGTSKATSSPTSYGGHAYSSYPSSYQSTKLPPATTTAGSAPTYNTYSQGQYGSSPAAYPGSFSQSAYGGQSAAPVQQNSVYQSSSQHGAFSSPPSAPSGFRDNQYATEASSNSYPPSAYGQQSSTSPYPASTTSGFQAYVSTTRASALPGSNITPSLSKYGDGSTSTANLTSGTTTTTSSPMAAGTSTVTSISLTPSSASLSTGRTAGSTNKTSPNLPPGVSAPMLGQNQFVIPQSTIPGMPFYGMQGVQQPIYFDDPQQQQQLQRLLLPYYDMSSFQMPASLPSTATDQARMTGLNYTGSGADAKLTRVDAQSPVNATQSSQQQQQQQPQSTHQQPYINAAMPPYYYYGLPGQIPYMFPQGVTNTASGHGSSTVNQPYQKQQAYGSHTGYGAGYDDLSQSQTADFKTAYGVSQPQSKGSTAVMTTVSTGGVADISSVYSKNHAPSAFDKTGYSNTPPSYNLPTLAASGSQGGALAAPSTPYGAHMFVPTLPHQQMMHHQMQPDASGVAARGSQQGAGQQKTSLNKGYGASHYWSGN